MEATREYLASLGNDPVDYLSGIVASEISNKGMSIAWLDDQILK
jgi:hypothetical protein